jgi:hypothetical protein
MSISFKLGDDGAEGKLKVNGFGSCKLVPYGVLADFDSKFDNRWQTTKENEDWEDFIDWNTRVDQLKDEVYNFIPTEYFNKTELASFSYLSEGDLINSNSSVNQWAGAFATNEKAAAAYTLAVDANYTDLDGNTISAVSGIQLGAIAGQDNKSSYMDFMADNIRFFAASARIVDEETGKLTPASTDIDGILKAPTNENGDPLPAFGMLAEPDGQGGYQYKTYFNGNVIFLDGPNSGSTLIKGGYINTDLIETDKLIVGADNTARHFGSWGTGDDVQDGDNIMQDSGGQLATSEVEQRNPTYGSITFRDGDTYFNIGEGSNYVYDSNSGMWKTTKGADSSGYSINLSEDLYVAHRDGSGNWDTSGAQVLIDIFYGNDNVTDEFMLSIMSTPDFNLSGNVLAFTGSLSGDKPSAVISVIATNKTDSNIRLMRSYRIITLEDGSAYRLNIHQPVVKLAPNGVVASENTVITWNVAHYVGNNITDVTSSKTVYYKGPGDSGYTSAGTDGTVNIGDLVDSTHNTGEVEFIITEDNSSGGTVYDKEILPIVWDAGSPYTLQLTNDVSYVPASESGIVSSGWLDGDIATGIEVYLGAIDKTAQCSPRIINYTGGTAAISGNTVYLTSITADVCNIVVGATYDGVNLPTSVSKTFTVTKNRQGQASTSAYLYSISLSNQVLTCDENYNYGGGNVTWTVSKVDENGNSYTAALPSGWYVRYNDSIGSGTSSSSSSNFYVSAGAKSTSSKFGVELVGNNSVVIDAEHGSFVKIGKTPVKGVDYLDGQRGAVSVEYDFYNSLSEFTSSSTLSATLWVNGQRESGTSTWFSAGDALLDFIKARIAAKANGDAQTGDKATCTLWANGNAVYQADVVYTGSYNYNIYNTTAGQYVFNVKQYVHGSMIVEDTIAADKVSFIGDSTGTNSIYYDAGANNGKGALVMGSIEADSVAAENITGTTIDGKNITGAYGKFTKEVNDGFKSVLYATSSTGERACYFNASTTGVNPIVQIGTSNETSYSGLTANGSSRGVVASSWSSSGTAVLASPSSTVTGYGFYTEGQCYFEGSTYPFTGAHIGLLHVNCIYSVGDILYDLGTTIHKDVNNALSYVDITSTARCKAVVGVINSSSNIEGGYVPLDTSVTQVGVNSVGEGLMNVCSQNGDIECGDYICSSDVRGKGMKQDDDLLHNYTVAKARENIVWDELEVDNDKVFELDGYKWTQIACTYHCG